MQDGGQAEIPWRAAVLGVSSVAAVLLGSRPMAANGQEAAQEPARGVTITERPRPELDPLGLRIGGFLLYLRAGVEEQYDGNIFSTDTSEIDDFITVVNPSFQLRSDWNNHALNLFGTASVGLHADNSGEDYEDFTLGGDGRLDVQRDTAVTASFSFSDLHEERGSPDDVNGEEPTKFDVWFPQAGLSQRFGRFGLNIDGALKRFDYGDVRTSLGTVINNDDRDRNEWEAAVRLGYEIVPAYEAFVRGSYNVRDYDDAVDDNGFDRDSTGFEIVAGAAIDLGGVTFGDAFVGFRLQDPEDPALQTTEGIQFGGRVTSNITDLTTIQGFVIRTIEETTLVGTPGAFATQVGASVDHELLRNLLIGADASFTRKDWKGINRKDDDITAGIYARYLLNRNFYMSLRYDFKDRSSNIANEDFRKNIVILRLETQY